jgi:hypothetical protein
MGLGRVVDIFTSERVEKPGTEGFFVFVLALASSAVQIM